MNLPRTLTITSLLSILLTSFHLSDDIVRGFEPGKMSTLGGVLIMAVWLWGTLVLAGRRSGYVIVFLGSLLGSGIPVLHMSRAGLVVMVPISSGLASGRIQEHEVDALVEEVELLRNRPDVDAARIGIIGFSVGGSVAIQAAADPRLDGKLVFVNAFGSYFDTGSIKVKTRGSNALIAEWSGCTGFNSLLWSDSLGGAAYFLGATGVSNVKVTVLGGGREENWLIAEGTWR